LLFSSPLRGENLPCVVYEIIAQGKGEGEFLFSLSLEGRGQGEGEIFSVLASDLFLFCHCE